jgi:hypothetical protein
MLVFDGSDVGVNSTDLVAFSFVDADTILMSFDDTVTVTGLAITPQDVVYFNATSLGSVTSGTFSMLLDGSNMGLGTNAEKIDSVGLSPDRLILISTAAIHLCQELRARMRMCSCLHRYYLMDMARS